MDTVAKKRIEILAPVGSPESLEAAVYAGADSVYLGLQGFNARRGAGNFTPEQLCEAVSLCHAYGVGVHVTLNTLVQPAELAGVQAAIQAICVAGADAVLVQDWAVARLVKSCAPALRMHASTQLAVSDLAGARLAAEYGFDRVVLARELSGEEIKIITQGCGIETEAFIHGAQCMCVSGQCYMSAFLGGRSGNRGGCAQPCRLPFAAFMGTTPPARSAQQTGRNDLSLKDMSALSHLPELEAMGVSSVKIEGRLRGPEYVAAAVHAAFLARDGQPYDEGQLQRIFSRSGFTDGYFTGNRTREMFGIRTPEDAVATRTEAPAIREYYRRPPCKVPVQMSLTLEQEGARLRVTDGVQTAVAYCTEPSEQTPGESYPAALEKSLAKTGGTPFVLQENGLTLTGEKAFFQSLSHVNELRRTALESLYQKRAAARPVPFSPAVLPTPQGAVPTGLRDAAGHRMLIGRFEDPCQLTEQTADLFYRVVLPLRCIRAQLPEDIRKKCVIELPRGNFGDSDRLQVRLEDAIRGGFNCFEANNPGHLQLLRAARKNGSDIEIWGGWALNVINPVAARELAQLGVSQQTLSPEVRVVDLAQFAGLSVRTSLLAYGRLPVMMTRVCPLQNITDCARCTKRGKLLDRKGEQLPVICRGSVREIYNPVPIWMGDRQHEAACDLLTLYFTWETADRVAAVTGMFRNGCAFDTRFTRGLYYTEGSI